MSTNSPHSDANLNTLTKDQKDRINNYIVNGKSLILADRKCKLTKVDYNTGVLTCEIDNGDIENINISELFEEPFQVTDGGSKSRKHLSRKRKGKKSYRKRKYGKSKKGRRFRRSVRSRR
jgi:hypothetical protein